jgi:hypothetical protein
VLARGCSLDDFVRNKTDQTQISKNRQHLKLLTNTRVADLLNSGVIGYKEIGSVKRLHDAMGVRFVDTTKPYLPPGTVLRVPFIRKQYVHIKIPDPMQLEHDPELEYAQEGNIISVESHPYYRYLLKKNRLCKKRHVWIYSSFPDSGKSTAVNFLKAKCRAFEARRTKQYWLHPVDTTAQIILFDEYAKNPDSCLPAPELNAICDNQYVFNIKYGQPVRMQTDLPVVVVFSNYHPGEVYTKYNPETKQHEPDTMVLQLLYARFEIFQIR